MPIQFTTTQIKDAAITAAKIDTSGTFTFTSGIVEVADITSGSGANYAAPKSYVDSVANGLFWKDAVSASSEANIVGTYTNGVLGVGAALALTGAGALVLDDITVTAGQRVLVKDQTTSFQNGIYTLSTDGSALGASGTITMIAPNTMTAGVKGKYTATVVTFGSITGAVAPAGTITVANSNNIQASDTIRVIIQGGGNVDFVEGSGGGQWAKVTDNNNQTANNIASIINTNVNFAAVAVGAVVTVTYPSKGTTGNANAITQSSGSGTGLTFGAFAGGVIGHTLTIDNKSDVAKVFTFVPNGTSPGSFEIQKGIDNNGTAANMARDIALQVDFQTSGTGAVRDIWASTTGPPTGTPSIATTSTGNITFSSANMTTGTVGDVITIQNAGGASSVFSAVASVPGADGDQFNAGAGTNAAGSASSLSTRINANSNFSASVNGAAPTSLTVTQAVTGTTGNGRTITSAIPVGEATFVNFANGQVAGNGTLTRSTDMDVAIEFPSAAVFVKAGTDLGDTGWVCTNDSDPVIGTTAIAFVQVTGAGHLTAGNGISIAGNTVSVNLDGDSLLVGVGGLKINVNGVDTNELAADAVEIEQAGWRWKSKVAVVGDTITNSIAVDADTDNAGFQGPESVFVFRNGQTMLPDAATTAGTGTLSGKYGVTIASNRITVVFDGYLGNGDQMEVRYMI